MSAKMLPMTFSKAPKMAKQHLKLTKEIQCRDFDALITHITIICMRYVFIAYRIRMENEHRSSGELLYSCCEELSDISYTCIPTLCRERLRERGESA